MSTQPRILPMAGAGLALLFLSLQTPKMARAEDAPAAPAAAAPAAAAPVPAAATAAPTAEAGPKTVIITLAPPAAASAIGDPAVPIVATPGTPSELAKKAYTFLIAALQSGKYQKLIDLGDDELKAAVRNTPFDQVTALYAPRLKQGYEAVYFGDFRKAGSEFYFWKLTFKDGGDDVLVQLSTKAKKLNGFFLL